jgi:tetratricopeptide (TPR) repeat protein
MSRGRTTVDGRNGFPAARLRDGWIPALALLALVIAAYQGVRGAGFIWDDEMHVTQNPVIVGPLGLKEIWTSPAARYFPLTLTTFWAEHALWGLDPRGYHAVNVLLHGVCAVLLWRVLRRLAVPGAWLGAALWALHPVQAETVAWVTELKNTQSGVFFLLAALVFLKSLDAGTGERPGPSWSYALTLVFGAMAMASKSSTVILPIVLGLGAWWREGRWRWRVALSLAPLLVMAALSGALSLWTQHLEGANEGAWSRSWGERIAVSGHVIWFYLGKLVWPHPLIFIYPRWTVAAGQAAAYGPIAAAVGLGIALWWGRLGWAKPFFFAYAFFVAALLPVLGLLDQFFWRYSFVGDHFQYLASMGPLALAAAGIATGLAASPRALRGLGWAGCGAVLLILGVLTARQCPKFRSSEALWRDTLDRNPSAWMAHNNLGAELLRRGRIAEAVDQLRASAELEPTNASAQSNLGDALFQMGRFDEAIARDREALRLDPRNVVTQANLGAALLQAGRLQDAEAVLRKALLADPDYAAARMSLGTVYLQGGREADAIRELTRALASDARNESALTNLGVALARTGRLEEARDAFERALTVNPRFFSAQANLGNAWMQLGRTREAIEAYEKAAQLDPGSAAVHWAIATACLKARRYDQAIAHCLQALALNPRYPEAEATLAEARAEKQRAESIFYDPPQRSP